MKRILTIIALAAALTPGLAPAAPERLKEFSGPEQRERYRGLLGELRCLVCQNQSLASSDADLAKDLRNEVYKKVREGESNEAIIDYLVARYGDFVLYQPPVKPATYFLWFGPLFLLLVGAGVLVAVVRRRNRPARTELTAEDKARAAQLLGTDPYEDEKQ